MMPPLRFILLFASILTLWPLHATAADMTYAEYEAEVRRWLKIYPPKAGRLQYQMQRAYPDQKENNAAFRDFVIGIRSLQAIEGDYSRYEQKSAVSVMKRLKAYSALHPKYGFASLALARAHIYNKDAKAAKLELNKVAATEKGNPQFIALSALQLALSNKVPAAQSMCIDALAKQYDDAIALALFKIIKADLASGLYDQPRKQKIFVVLKSLNTKSLAVNSYALAVADGLAANAEIKKNLTDKLLSSVAPAREFNPVKEEVGKQIEELYGTNNTVPEAGKTPSNPNAKQRPIYRIPSGYTVSNVEDKLNLQIIEKPTVDDIGYRGLVILATENGPGLEQAAIIDLTRALQDEHQSQWFIHRGFAWLRLKKPKLAAADIKMGFSLVPADQKSKLAVMIMKNWNTLSGKYDFKYTKPFLADLVPHMQEDKAIQGQLYAYRLDAREKGIEAELKNVLKDLKSNQERAFYSAFIETAAKIGSPRMTSRSLKDHYPHLYELFSNNMTVLMDLLLIQIRSSTLDKNLVTAVNKAIQRRSEKTFRNKWQKILWYYHYDISASEFELLKPLMPKVLQLMSYSTSYLAKIFALRIKHNDDPEQLKTDLDKALKRHKKLAQKDKSIAAFLANADQLIAEAKAKAKKEAEDEAAQLAAAKAAEEAKALAEKEAKAAHDQQIASLLKANDIGALVKLWIANPGKQTNEDAVYARISTKLLADETWRMLGYKLRPKDNNFKAKLPALPPVKTKYFNWIDKVLSLVNHSKDDFEKRYMGVLTEKMGMVVHPELYRWRAQYFIRKEDYGAALRDFKLASLLFQHYGAIADAERIDPWIVWAERLKNGTANKADIAFKELDQKRRVWGFRRASDFTDRFMAHYEFYTGEHRGHYMAEAALNDMRARFPSSSFASPLALNAKPEAIKRKLKLYKILDPAHYAALQAKGVEAFQAGKKRDALKFMDLAAGQGAGEYQDFYTARTLIHRALRNDIDEYCDIICAFKGKPLTIGNLGRVFKKLEQRIAGGDPIKIYNTINGEVDSRIKQGDYWSAVYLNIFRLNRLINYRLKDKLAAKVKASQTQVCHQIIASSYERLHKYDETIKYALEACRAPGNSSVPMATVYLLAFAYGESGRAHEGIRTFQSLNKPRAQDIEYYLGYLYTKTGNISMAQVQFDKALKRPGVKNTAGLWMGEWLIEAKAYKAAVKYLQPAVDKLSATDKNRPYWKRQLTRAKSGIVAKSALNDLSKMDSTYRPWEDKLKPATSHPMPWVNFQKNPTPGVDLNGKDFVPAQQWSKTPVGSFLKYQVEQKTGNRAKRHTLWQVVKEKTEKGLVVTQILGPPNYYAALPPNPLPPTFRSVSTLVPFGSDLFAVPVGPQAKVQAGDMKLGGWFTGGSDASNLVICKKLTRTTLIRQARKQASVTQEWMFTPDVPFSNVFTSKTTRIIGNSVQSTEMRLNAMGMIPPENRPALVMLEEAASLNGIMLITNYPDKVHYERKLIEAYGREGELELGGRFFDAAKAGTNRNKALLKYAGISNNEHAWKQASEDVMTKAIIESVRESKTVDLERWESLLGRLKTQKAKDEVRSSIVYELCDRGLLDKGVEQINKVSDPEAKRWAIDKIRTAARPENMAIYYAKAVELGGDTLSLYLDYAKFLRRNGKRAQALKQLEVAKTYAAQHKDPIYHPNDWALIIHEQLTLEAPDSELKASIAKLNKVLEPLKAKVNNRSLAGTLINLYARLGDLEKLKPIVDRKLTVTDMYWAWRTMAYAKLGKQQAIIDYVIKKVAPPTANSGVNVNDYQARVGMHQQLAKYYQDDHDHKRSTQNAELAYKLAHKLLDQRWLNNQKKQVISVCGMAIQAQVNAEAFDRAYDFCELMRSYHKEDVGSIEKHILIGYYSSVAKDAKVKAPEITYLCIRRINNDKSEYKCKLGVIRHLIRHGHDGLAKELAMLEPTPGGRSDLEAIVIEEQALYSDIENARRSLNAYRPVKVVNAQVAMLAMAAREAKEGNWKKARHYIERANDKPFKATDSFKLNAGFDPDIQGFEDMIIDAGRYAAMSGATIQELHAWLASEQRLEYRAPLAYGMALGYQGIHPKKSMSEMLYGIKRK